MIKFKYYKTENKFRSDLTGNKIDSDDIVFVEDSGILSTHSLEWGFVDRINGFLPLSDDWAILKGDVHQGPTIIHRWPGSNGAEDEYATINFPYLYSGDSLTLATTEQLPEPDWNETVTTNKNYIKNKPDLSEINEKLGILNHEYVDLGLPSGTLWATMNVGATSVTDYGNYYMYGKGTTQYNSSDSTYTGSEITLNSNVDTATQVWGEGWHIPTKELVQELLDNTTHEYYTIGTTNGYKCTASNGNYIFLPACGLYEEGYLNVSNISGYYWTSTGEGTSGSYGLEIHDDYSNITIRGRDEGISVRPVHSAIQKDYYTKSEVDNLIEASQGVTDYNDLTNKPVIPEGSGDDAARANWGGDWRMPTTAEFQALGAAINTAWTQVNNVYGILCTDKEDSSKTLFFPVAGYCYDGSFKNVGSYGRYWSSSLNTVTKTTTYGLSLYSDSANWSGYFGRYYGFTVRPILDGTNANGHDYVEIGGIKWATMNIGANSVTDYGLYFQWGDIQGYTASQVGSGTGQKYFGWADYKYGNGTSSPGATGMTKYNATDSKTVLDLSTPVEYLHKVAVTGDYNDLSNKPTIPTIPTTISSFTNDAGYLVSSDIAGKADKSTTYTKTEVDNLVSPKANSADLATVATSGSYNDLSNKPTIPSPTAVKGDAESSYRTGNVNITPTNIGLGNVGNFKAVSTVASQGLSSTELSNARANIGAGTSSFSGSYTDLTDKPTIPTVPTNVSTFANDAGYITGYTETDPTVPAWAKASTKPTYIANEVMSISRQTITANTSSSCSITGSSNNGKAETIIYQNNSGSDVTVTVPTTYETPDGEEIELTCVAGGYCEVSYLNISGTIYARGL